MRRHRPTHYSLAFLTVAAGFAAVPPRSAPAMNPSCLSTTRPAPRRRPAGAAPVDEPPAPPTTEAPPEPETPDGAAGNRASRDDARRIASHRRRETTPARSPEPEPTQRPPRPSLRPHERRSTNAARAPLLRPTAKRRRRRTRRRCERAAARRLGGPPDRLPGARPGAVRERLGQLPRRLRPPPPRHRHDRRAHAAAARRGRRHGHPGPLRERRDRRHRHLHHRRRWLVLQLLPRQQRHTWHRRRRRRSRVAGRAAADRREPSAGRSGDRVHGRQRQRRRLGAAPALRDPPARPQAGEPLSQPRRGPGAPDLCAHRRRSCTMPPRCRRPRSRSSRSRMRPLADRPRRAPVRRWPRRPRRPRGWHRVRGRPAAGRGRRTLVQAADPVAAAEVPAAGTGAPDPAAATATPWTVERGESLWSITQEAYGVSDVSSTVSLVGFVFDHNGDVLVDPDSLDVGMTLQLPPLRF